MALFDMLEKERVSFACAFVNYHVREQAEEEEAYVKQLCESHGIELHVLDDPFTWTGNFEAAARDYRYDFFVRCVKENNYAGIVTGHQEDDLLETWLMQRRKGITPQYYGLAEKSVMKGVVLIRPLLSCSKEQLLQYCEDHQVKYYTDHTNLLPVHERNRLRIDVVSGMSEEERTLMRKEIDEANAHLSFVRNSAENLFTDGYVLLDQYRSAEKEVRLCVLRCFYEQIKSPSGKELEEADRIVMKKRDFLIEIGDAYLAQDDGRMFLGKKFDTYSYSFDEISLMETPCFAVRNEGKGTEALTLSASDFPITIRSFEDGDSIAMRFGTKSVHRFFIDRKIPLYQRSTWPVVVNRLGEVILVPGLGCDVSHYSDKPGVYVVQLAGMEAAFYVGRERY